MSERSWPIREAPQGRPSPTPELLALLEDLRVRHAKIRATCARQSREAIQMRRAAEEIRRRLQQVKVGW